MSNIVKDGLSPATPMFSQNTPMLPKIIAQELEERNFMERVKQHEIHQKVRWCKLLLKISKIMKWCIILTVWILFLPLSMYSVLDYPYIMLISFWILMIWYVDQINTQNKFILLDIEINFYPNSSRIATPNVPNINQFTMRSVKKTLIYYISEKPTSFIIGFSLILIYSILFPFISSDLWVGVYDQSEGLVFNNIVVSTYFSRFLDK